MRDLKDFLINKHKKENEINFQKEAFKNNLKELCYVTVCSFATSFTTE